MRNDIAMWRGGWAVACAAAAAFLVAGTGGTALAQSATPGSTIQLETILVEGENSVGREGGAVPASVAERFKVLPGGAAIVTKDGYGASGNLTVSEALRDVPGVVVQDFFGGNDQPRIQIRGSGLQQNPVERGVLVLQDGLPINRADGSYIVGFANPHRHRRSRSIAATWPTASARRCSAGR